MLATGASQVLVSTSSGSISSSALHLLPRTDYIEMPLKRPTQSSPLPQFTQTSITTKQRSDMHGFNFLFAFTFFFFYIEQDLLFVCSKELPPFTLTVYFLSNAKARGFHASPSHHPTAAWV